MPPKKAHQPGRVSGQKGGVERQDHYTPEPEGFDPSELDQQVEDEPKKVVDWNKKRKVKVYRTDLNKHIPISICVNNRKSRKVFMSGQTVLLSESMIHSLKNCVIEHRIPIPEESGIYRADDPRLEAMNQNPGWDAEYDFTQGLVYLVKTESTYVVVPVEES